MNESTRRDFLKSSALAALAFYTGARAGAQERQKLNLGIIGTGGKGGDNLNQVASENIVALCDVDANHLAGPAKRFPQAKTFADFRVMFDQVKSLDAVVVSTPDHTHAVAICMALRLGKHVYGEKPVTRTVHEARMVRQLAAEAKVATQMGNASMGSDRLREGIEAIRSGVIGQVSEVHVWTDRPIWPQGIDRPAGTPACPASLSWDLWLGPSPGRPYHPAYHPFKWRGFWDFGTGALGDMACHNCSMPFMALKLAWPTAVEPVSMSGKSGETAPVWSVVRYDFPARGDLVPVKMWWYEGGKKPSTDLVNGRPLPGNGIIMVGDKGVLYAPDQGAGGFRLLPEDKFKGWQKPPATLARSQGHHREWLQACRGESVKPLSNFAYATLLTEVVVLGAAAQRLGTRLAYDGSTGQVTNEPNAAAVIQPPYRPGWAL